MFAVIDDLRKPWQQEYDVVERTHVEPHADEVTTDMMEPEISQHENIKFEDNEPGYMEQVISSFDPTRDGPLTNDADLGNFFMRPLRIASYDWAVGSTLYQRFNPWTLFFENPRVINRLSNYKLMRAKLHVKVVVNGTPFHYGRAIMSYNPLPTYDTMTIDREFVDADIVGASQRPHIYIDPCEGQGGEMELPFFHFKNLLDITLSEWREMGEMVINSMQGLKHANDDSTLDSRVTINVFAWATEVKFAVPTQAEPTSIVPQADEYGDKPVSRIATAVAKGAGYLKSVPWIGRYALATQVGAQAIGKVAQMFGYSAPPQLDINPYRPVATTNLAMVNIPSDVAKLSVDCKQELTIDPTISGLGPVDELAIKNLACKESFLVPFPWTTAAQEEELLFNMRVDPGLHVTFGSEKHFPASAFVANLFKYWRGTMKIRFQFVCSKYHRGRVKLVYDPSGTPAGGNAEYNTAYTTIVDISDNSDFTMEVGWAQNTPYRYHLSPLSSSTQMYNILPLTGDSTYTIGNGTLSMYVVNRLTVPQTTINNDIEVNVFVSMGDDVEFAVPTEEYLNLLRFTAAGTTTAPSSIVPQALETDADSPDRGSSSKPVDPVVMDTLAQKVGNDDNTNLIHFGESISSLRQMIKRFSRHQYIPSHAAGQTGLLKCAVGMNALPHQGGYTTTHSAGNGITFSLTNGTYVYAKTHPLAYIASAFGGWRGGIRYLYDFSLIKDGADEFSPVVTRAEVGQMPGAVWSEITNSSTTAAGQAELYNDDAIISNAYDGSYLTSSIVNPLLKFEVPYYSRFRFTPSKRFSNFVSNDNYQPGYFVEWVSTASRNTSTEFIPTFAAAGEDFNCFFYLGLPIMYIEGTAPVA